MVDKKAHRMSLVVCLRDILLIFSSTVNHMNKYGCQEIMYMQMDCIK